MFIILSRYVIKDLNLLAICKKDIPSKIRIRSVINRPISCATSAVKRSSSPDQRQARPCCSSLERFARQFFNLLGTVVGIKIP